MEDSISKIIWLTILLIVVVAIVGFIISISNYGYNFRDMTVEKVNDMRVDASIGNLRQMVGKESVMTSKALYSLIEANKVAVGDIYLTGYIQDFTDVSAVGALPEAKWREPQPGTYNNENPKAGKKRENDPMLLNTHYDDILDYQGDLYVRIVSQFSDDEERDRYRPEGQANLEFKYDIIVRLPGVSALPLGLKVKKKEDTPTIPDNTGGTGGETTGTTGDSTTGTGNTTGGTGDEGTGTTGMGTSTGGEGTTGAGDSTGTGTTGDGSTSGNTGSGDTTSTGTTGNDSTTGDTGTGDTSGTNSGTGDSTGSTGGSSNGTNTGSGD